MAGRSRCLLFAGAVAVVLGFETRAEGFTAAFSWAGIPACQTTSPAFELHQVPVGTKRLRFVMHDVQVPAFQHGGSTISYNGDAVPRGAIHYIGPCPPRGERHRYRWTIEALDNSGKALGETTAEATFPP